MIFISTDSINREKGIYEHLYNTAIHWVLDTDHNSKKLNPLLKLKLRMKRENMKSKWEVIQKEEKDD